MIKEYFLENCISIRQWAKKHNLHERTTYFVINGKLTGTIKSNHTKAVFEALLKEGIIDEMPKALRDAS
ncbi:hypothetical protein F1B92_03805 [Campylobacter sp. FMV-PI01]|uniref:DNA-binding protein n=1 Tax=Campylobacter portucalensis TaxID=2608384 RepID=A0A6L5WH11_9BACT|nr:hypothetical protein [Campylobacter portucalensis]MSN96324.1 hypothetical protein [Campylobacter portucalensis]